MIELKNISKTYKNKKNKIRALKNINISFNDNGLVFVVGKSGCGKSTLLNIIGTLDKFDEGQIIIDGKDISRFSEKELNNFRNNNLGFVFQEFNLLEDYNVYNNLAMTLDLQGRIVKKEDIDEILLSLQLENVSKRNISELSGGQKQRVAIARALLKRPKILLCDEPKGALDSQTSEEIFKLLKDVSKKCLVIVVSHDYEAAQMYGDRIIKIKDGQIEYDKEINEIESLTFNKQPNKNKVLFTRLFSLGFNFFKQKPIRLVISIFLSIVAIVLFCLSFSISRNTKSEVITRSMLNDNASYISYENEIWYEIADSYGYKLTNMSNDDINQIVKDTGINDYYNCKIQNFELSLPYEYNYYYMYNNGFMEINESVTNSYGFMLYGQFPQNDDEVVITKYIYEIFEKYNYKRFDTVIKIDKYDDLLNQILYLDDEKWGGKDFKIVGILDTKFDSERYKHIFENKNNSNNHSWELDQMMRASMHNIVYLNEGYYQRNYVDDFSNGITSQTPNMQICQGDKFIEEKYNILSINSNKLGILLENEEYANSSNGIYIPLSTILLERFSSYMYDIVNDFANKNYEKIKDEIRKDHPNIISASVYANYIINNNYTDDKYCPITYDEIKNMTLKKYIIDNGRLDMLNENLSLINGELNYNYKYNAKIAGILDDSEYDENGNVIRTDAIYVTDKMYNELISDYEYLNYDYDFITIPFPEDYKSALNLVEYTEKENDQNFKLKMQWEGGSYKNSYFKSYNPYFTNYLANEESINNFSNIFFIVSIVLLSLVVGFIYFYYSGVILDKKRDIGILRTLGMSRSNILKSLIISNLILDLVVITLSLILTCFAYVFINSSYVLDKKSILVYMNFKFELFIVIVVISTISIFLGTFIPTFRIIHKYPNELLANK